MRILWVTTKPPWPAMDGGRRLVMETLFALSACGHRIALLSPYDPTCEDPARIVAGLSDCCDPHLVAVRPRSRVASLFGAWKGGLPATIVKHSLQPLREEAARLSGDGSFDVAHAEQLQALSQLAPLSEIGVPVGFRAQNVESDLWFSLAESSGIAGVWLRHEARRLARYEGRAVRAASATLSLTARDAERLRALAAGWGRVHHVPAPFPERLAGAPVLPGEPAVVVIGSPGWLPNRLGAAWFVREVWSRVRARVPGALLHLFGLSPETTTDGSIVQHGSPDESGEAFPEGGILAVPLGIASGVRMKILEAWARGLPVVATPCAAEGLDARDGRELLLARDAAEFAQAIARCHEDARFASASVEAGRKILRERHDPRRVAEQLSEIYSGLSRG